MIAALFVQKNGCYWNLPGVDPWDKERDARKYAGPYPVIAHPPCERWGRYWSGGPNPNVKRKELGSDNGCFEHALVSVRAWSGVLEHPEASHAWKRFGLNRPPRNGGWIKADNHGGWTCCVAQGNYGHLANKWTWLYCIRTDRPEFSWGKSQANQKFEMSPRSKEHALELRRKGTTALERLSKDQRLATPVQFRDLLISIADSCNG